MEPLLNGEDHNMVAEAVREGYRLFTKALVISRYVSKTGGAVNGVIPTVTTLDIRTRGHVYAVSQKDILDSAGFFSVGDIKTNTLMDIIGFDNSASNLKNGDKLLFEGKKYIVNGKPHKVKMAGGRVYTQAAWKQA